MPAFFTVLIGTAIKGRYFFAPTPGGIDSFFSFWDECGKERQWEEGKGQRAKGEGLIAATKTRHPDKLGQGDSRSRGFAHCKLLIAYWFSCACIRLTRSSSFSEVRFSRMLSTFIGKQNGVNCWGNVMMMVDCCILSNMLRSRTSSIC
jgi:hypothetical protein